MCCAIFTKKGVRTPVSQGAVILLVGWGYVILSNLYFSTLLPRFSVIGFSARYSTIEHYELAFLNC